MFIRQHLAQLLTVRSQNEDAQQRGRMVLIIALGLVATSLLLLPLVLQPTSSLAGRFVVGGGIFVYLGVFFLARFGWITSGALIIITLNVIGILGAMRATGTVSFSVFYLALSLLIASLTLRPWQIWLVLLAIVCGVGILVRSLPTAALAEQTSRSMLIGGVIFLGMVSLISSLGASSMARVLRTVRQARTQVEASAAHLARSNVTLEQRIGERTAALQTALTEVQTRAAAQARLLAENEQQRMTIREMSVPVIPVSTTTMVIPLIGTLDRQRLAQLNAQALRSIARTATRHLILDITGVVIVDSQVAQGIIAVVQSARLLGTEVILVGIRPEVAQTVVQLGLNLVGMRTFSTLQTALSGINN